jgi:signal peptidase II
MLKHRKAIISTIAILLLTALDHVTKVLAGQYLAGKGTIRVLGDYAIFEYIKNRGAFLSFGHGLNDIIWAVVFVAIPLIVLAGLTVYILTQKSNDRFYLTLWVLLMSGGLGNIKDRIFEGKVTDFMNIGIGSVRTGIFNVADLYIVLFAVILGIKLIKSIREEASADSH